MDKVFPKYPNIYKEIKDQSKIRYAARIRQSVMKHKIKHIGVVNTKSTYNTMKLDAKADDILGDVSQNFVEGEDDGGYAKIVWNFN